MKGGLPILNTRACFGQPLSEKNNAIIAEHAYVFIVSL